MLPICPKISLYTILLKSTKLKIRGSIEFKNTIRGKAIRSEIFSFSFLKKSKSIKVFSFVKIKIPLIHINPFKNFITADTVIVK